MKKSLFTIFLLLTGFCASAKSPALRFSAELDWGYAAQIYSSKIFVYYPNSINYRVNDIQRGPTFFNNAYCNLGAGIDFLDYFSLHLKAGFQGVDRDFIITPFQAQLRFFTNGYGKNGHFFMAEGGAALRKLNFDDRCFLAAFGAGYRYCLYRRCCLDICASAQLINCSPQPYDKVEGYIPRKQIVASDVTYVLLSLGLGISF